MKRELSWPIFWTLPGVFAALAIAVLTPIRDFLRFGEPGGFTVIFVLAAAFTLLGVALLFFDSVSLQNERTSLTWLGAPFLCDWQSP